MCFSAEASLGVAAVLLPTGGYCLAAAWRKDQSYLAIAAMPVLFGLQQLCEAVVWLAVGWGNPDAARRASLAFLFFALALWPVWAPLALAILEPRRWTRALDYALLVLGVLFAASYYVPLLATQGLGIGPDVIGHSLRYDFSMIPAVQSAWWQVWPVMYLAAVCVPFMISSNRRLPRLGVAVLVAAVATYALFEHAFASVWCFLAAGLSVYLAWTMHRLPDRAESG